MFPVNVNGLAWLAALIGTSTQTLFLPGKVLLISFIHNGEGVYFSGYIVYEEQLEMEYSETEDVEAALFRLLETEAWETMMTQWLSVPYSGKLNDKE